MNEQIPSGEQQVPMSLVCELIGEKELALRLQQVETARLREELAELAAEIEALRGEAE